MSNLRARFYRDGNSDWVEITIIGDPNVAIRKVSQQDIADFPLEWQAYLDQSSEPEPDGLPLTDVPGLTPEVAKRYRQNRIRTVEELAALSDMACARLGMGVLTMRKAAQNHLAALRLERLEAVTMNGPAEPKRRGRPPKAATEQRQGQ